MKNNFAKFQANEISPKETQKVLGGNGVNPICFELEAELEAAAARGDSGAVRRILRQLEQECYTDGY